MQGMTLIVKTITRLAVILILVFGAYTVMYGHLTPGGGFAGGVILAAAFVLLTLAFGKEVALARFSRRASSVWDSLGALGFLLVAFLGLLVGGGVFFKNFASQNGQPFHLFSAGIIPWCNIFIGIKVGACLFGAFVALIIFRAGGSSDE